MTNNSCPECKSQVSFAPRTSLRFCIDCGWEGSYTQEAGAGLVAESKREENGRIDKLRAKKWRKNMNEQKAICENCGHEARKHYPECGICYCATFKLLLSVEDEIRSIAGKQISSLKSEVERLRKVVTRLKPLWDRSPEIIDLVKQEYPEALSELENGKRGE